MFQLMDLNFLHQIETFGNGKKDCDSPEVVPSNYGDYYTHPLGIFLFVVNLNPRTSLSQDILSLRVITPLKVETGNAGCVLRGHEPLPDCLERYLLNTS